MKHDHYFLCIKSLIYASHGRGEFVSRLNFNHNDFFELNDPCKTNAMLIKSIPGLLCSKLQR